MAMHEVKVHLAIVLLSDDRARHIDEHCTTNADPIKLCRKTSSISIRSLSSNAYCMGYYPVMNRYQVMQMGDHEFCQQILQPKHKFFAARSIDDFNSSPKPFLRARPLKEEQAGDTD
jgi:hypothetical protein